MRLQETYFTRYSRPHTLETTDPHELLDMANEIIIGIKELKTAIYILAAALIAVSSSYAIYVINKQDIKIDKLEMIVQGQQLEITALKQAMETGGLHIINGKK